jgi:hypothetical protein
MSYLKLPKRVFNSPLIAYANFEDESFVNLIRLIKPYANGVKYAVYETTKSPFCSNGLYTTLEKAKVKFDLMVKNAQTESKLIEQGDLPQNMDKGTCKIY